MRRNLTVDRRRKGPLPFVEAAKNLIRAVIELDDGESRVKALESLARRIRSWANFKRALRHWCERHGERRPRRP
jgi:hypothetical protein